MDSSVERIDLFWVELSDEGSKIFVNVVFKNVVFEFGWLFDIEVHFLKNLEYKFECFLIDVFDGNLNKYRITLEPF